MFSKSLCKMSLSCAHPHVLVSENDYMTIKTKVFSVMVLSTSSGSKIEKNSKINLNSD